MHSEQDTTFGDSLYSIEDWRYHTATRARQWRIGGMYASSELNDIIIHSLKMPITGRRHPTNSDRPRFFSWPHWFAAIVILVVYATFFDKENN